MYLDSTYFQGELAIPNLKRSGEPVGIGAALQSVHENTLEWFIAMYETEALEKILGYLLAQNFIKGMTSDPRNVIWQELYNMIYRETDGVKLSPIANYVYYWVQRDSVSKTAMIGEVKPQADKASNVSPDYKTVNAWNKMCPQIIKIRRYVNDNWDVYKPYSDSRNCFCGDICRPMDVRGI